LAAVESWMHNFTTMVQTMVLTYTWASVLIQI
jgi:hypothetical protein